MGAFRISEDLLTDRMHRASGDDLVRSVQMDRYGTSRGISTRGQMLLANWIMDDPVEREGAFEGRGFDLERLIAGEMLPGGVSAAVIELVTDKAVTFEHWSHRYGIDEPRAVEAPPSAGTRAGDDAGFPPVPGSSPHSTCACAPAGGNGRYSRPDRGAVETAQQGKGAAENAPFPDTLELGRLGERTHGRLFDAAACDGVIVVAGMGIALQMDEPTASILAERIEIALGVAADRRARIAGRL